MADAEDLSDYGDATFDVVTCNCGLMFMPNYERCRGIRAPLAAGLNVVATSKMCMPYEVTASVAL